MVVTGFNPDYAVPPGWTLEEALDDLSMSQADLARHTGLSEKHISQLIKGETPVTVDTAIRLERATDIPARLWNNLEHTYRATLARLAEEAELSEQIDFLDELPTAAMVSMGILTKRVKPIERLREVFEFFGVVNRNTWESVWEPTLDSVAFRKNPASDRGALAVWLRLGEKKATEVPCLPWDAKAFAESLYRIRDLTEEQRPDIWYPKLVQECANTGVAVVTVPEVKGARANGASRWLTSDRGLIQLSLRYKWNDIFWFSFFHEARHILDMHKRPIYINSPDNDNEQERRADAFARDFLIPPQYTPVLKNLQTLDEIKKFAEEIGVHPGIVVGRLQNDKVWPHHWGNGLRQRLAWATHKP